MQIDGETVTTDSDHARTAMATIARLGIPPTPENYAIWYEYHEGGNPDLSRTIDVLTSNRREFDEALLDEIYARFFSSGKDQQAVRDTARRVQETLREVMDAIGEANAGAQRYGATLRDVSGSIQSTQPPLAPLVARLIAETNEMARRSGVLGYRLRESGRHIEKLKNNLDSVRRQALTDALTGIANRRHFETVLREQAAAAMEIGENLCLLMIDIDHFKTFNDTWGHQTGDEVLKLVAKTLVENVKGQDVVARFGGEEFAVLLPKTSLDGSLAVAEAIRTAFERSHVVTRETKRSIGGITVSIGVACYDPGEPLARLVRRADLALYRAKREGRNRVLVDRDASEAEASR